MANHLVGIRTNSEEAGAWLDDVFAAFETEEEADPYYSIWVPEGDEGVGRQFYILYRESTDLIRTFHPAALARRLVAELDVLALRTSDLAPILDACIVRRNGVSALVPADILPYIRQLGRRKVDPELSLPKEPVVGVEPSSGHFFRPPRQLDVSDAALDDLARRLGEDVAAEGVTDSLPESVDLICAFHYDPDYPPILPLTRALAVHHLAQEMVNLRAIGGRALEPLAKLVEGKPCYLLQEKTPEEAFQLLKSAMDGDESQLGAAVAV